MQTLLIQGNLKVTLGKLVIETRTGKEIYSANKIPYNNIIISNTTGYISYEAIRMLSLKSIGLTIMKNGEIITKVTTTQDDAVLKLKQLEIYQNEKLRLEFAMAIQSGKLQKQIELLKYLEQRYDFNMPEFDDVNKANSLKQLMGIEAKNASFYWNAISEILNHLNIDFTARNSLNGRNMHATDLTNALLNYGYKLLENTISEYLTLAGLDYTIGIMHEIRLNKHPLVYDIMELYRFLIDYTVISLLENKIINKTQARITRDYDFKVKDIAAAKLVAAFNNTLAETVKFKKLNHRWESVIQLQCEQLAKCYKENKIPDFSKPKFEKEIPDNKQVRQEILETKYSDVSKAGKSKGTLYYRKQKILKGLPLKIYNKKY